MLYGNTEIENTSKNEGQDLARFILIMEQILVWWLNLKIRKTVGSKILNITPKTKISYGQLNAIAKKSRNDARKILRSKLPINDSQITQAEEILSKRNKLK